MPQLDTSTWFITVVSSTITLFIIMQLKINSQNFSLQPQIKHLRLMKIYSPWELKWTKICLPLSLPLQ